MDLMLTSAASTADIVASLRAAGCVFAEQEAQVLIQAARTPHELKAMVQQRSAGQPIEHVVGWADFCGLRVSVGPGVFVPRPRTELMVRQAASLTVLAAPDALVVDLCCGSGAIGLAVITTAGHGELHAADISPEAVVCARRNLSPVGGRVYLGDLFSPLPGRLRGRIDVLTANVPYVPSGEIAYLPPEARIYEPLPALDGGSDGLDLLRRVASEAGRWLTPGGHLLLETSQDQAAGALADLAAGGLKPSLVTDEELGATVVIGSRRR
jgi:release factor glutamine methyltransferase